jgi:hypothetical protein
MTERLGTKAGRKRRRREGAGDDLAHFEEILRRKHGDLEGNFYEVGAALRAIRDRRLYKAEFRSFEAYCADRWDLARTTAYQVIRASIAVDNVRDATPGHVVPANEGQARPLTKLPAQAQREVWVVVVETAPGGRITARHVEQAVAAYLARQGGNGRKGRRSKARADDKGDDDPLVRQLWLACHAAFDLYGHLIHYEGIMSPLEHDDDDRPSERTVRDWFRQELRRLQAKRHNLGHPLNTADIDPEALSLTYRTDSSRELLHVELRASIVGPAADGPGPGPAGQQATADVAKAVQGWYRQLSKMYHPDRAGASSTEAMKVVNECHDRLKKALGIA